MSNLRDLADELSAPMTSEQAATELEALRDLMRSEGCWHHPLSLAITALRLPGLESMTIAQLVALGQRIDEEFMRRDVCSHGIQVGERCPQCEAEYAAAIAENEAG